MKKYLKIIAIGLLVGSMIACSKMNRRNPIIRSMKRFCLLILGKSGKPNLSFLTIPVIFI